MKCRNQKQNTDYKLFHINHPNSMALKQVYAKFFFLLESEDKIFWKGWTKSSLFVAKAYGSILNPFLI